MISPEQYIQLVEFLEGRMSGSEKANFERQLALDKELREELTWEKILRDRDDISAEVESMLTQKSNIPFEKPVVVKPLVNLPWLAAASFLAVIVLSIGFIILNRQPAQYQIAIKENRDKPAPLNPRVDSLPVQPRHFDHLLAYNDYYKKMKPGENLPDGLGNVELAYQQSDYRRTIDEARNISGTRGQNSVSNGSMAYARYFEGLAQMELNQPARAVAAFDQAISLSSNPEFRDDVSWYKALALLKQNKMAESRAILEKLRKNKIIRDLMNRIDSVR